MAQENGAETPRDAGTGEGTKPETTTAPATAATPPATPATGEQEPWRNPAEIKKYMIRQRTLEDRLEKLEQEKTSTATVASKTESKNDPTDAGAKALAMVEKLQRDLELERAFAALDVKGEQRELLELAIAGANPPNVREFISKYVGKPGIGTSPSATDAAKPKTPVTDSGSPTVDDAASAAPKSPASLKPSEVAAMTPEQVVEHYQKYVKSQGGNVNPFASKKERTR